MVHCCVVLLLRQGDWREEENEGFDSVGFCALEAAEKELLVVEEMLLGRVMVVNLMVVEVLLQRMIL